MELLVKQLGFAGFPFQAVEVQQNQIEKIINNDKVFQETGVQVKQDAHIEEQKEIEKLLDELSRLYKQIATHKEEEEMVKDPAYCDYLHLQFYGEEFPKELTHHRKGFLFRVNHLTDSKRIAVWLRKIFSLEKYKYVERKNAQLMKIIPISSPGVELIEGELQYHWQKKPLIAIVFEVKSINEDIQKTYFNNDE